MPLKVLIPKSQMVTGYGEKPCYRFQVPVYIINYNIYVLVCSANDPRPGDGVLWWDESPAAFTGRPYNEPSSLDESLAPFEPRCLSAWIAVGWWWCRWWWWWSWSIRPNMPPRPGRKSSIISLPETPQTRAVEF